MGPIPIRQHYRRAPSISSAQGRLFVGGHLGLIQKAAPMNFQRTKKEPSEKSEGSYLSVIILKRGSGSPGPDNADNHHCRQRGTNTDYGVDPGRR